MSNLKERIVKKMQAGGTISYRSAYRITDSRAVFAPHLQNRGQAKGVMGGSKKSTKSSGEEVEGGEFYNSTRKELAAIEQKYMLEIQSIEGNNAISKDEKTRLITNLTLQGQEEMADKRMRGTQLKESLSNFDKSSARTNEISKEYIIKSSPDGTRATLLVAMLDDNKQRTGEYRFVDPYNARRSKNVEILTASTAIALAKNDPAFTYFLDRPDVEIDLPSELDGIITHAELQKSAVDYFDTNTITTSEDGTQIMVGDKSYDSASIAAQDKKGEINDITRKYMDSLTASQKARYYIEAGLRGKEAPELYINRFVMSVADIDIDEDSIKASKIGEGYSAWTEAITGGSTSVEQVTYRKDSPDIDNADDKKVKDASDRTFIRTNKKVTYIPSGAFALDPDAADNEFNSISIHKSPLLTSASRTGAVYDNMALLHTGEDLKSVLINKMHLPKLEANDLIENIQVRTDKGVGITYAVGLKGGNGKASRDLERMFLTLNTLLLGSQKAGAEGFVPGLQAKWLAEPEAASEAQVAKSQRDILARAKNRNTGKPLTKEEKAEHIRVVTAAQNKKHIEKRFKEDVINGDWLETYFIAKEKLTPEAAKAEAARYKEYLKNEQFVIVPQLMVTVDIPLITGNSESAFDEIKGFIGGDLRSATDKDRIRFKNDDLDEYFQTKVLIDINTTKLGVTIAGSKSQSIAGTNIDIDPQLAEDINALINKPQSLDNIYLYTEPVWNLLQ